LRSIAESFLVKIKLNAECRACCGLVAYGKGFFVVCEDPNSRFICFFRLSWLRKLNAVLAVDARLTVTFGMWSKHPASLPGITVAMPSKRSTSTRLLSPRQTPEGPVLSVTIGSN
jgi:hypothetical protein